MVRFKSLIFSYLILHYLYKPEYPPQVLSAHRVYRFKLFFLVLKSLDLWHVTTHSDGSFIFVYMSFPVHVAFWFLCTTTTQQGLDCKLQGIFQFNQ